MRLLNFSLQKKKKAVEKKFISSRVKPLATNTMQRLKETFGKKFFLFCDFDRRILMFVLNFK